MRAFSCMERVEARVPSEALNFVLNDMTGSAAWQYVRIEISSPDPLGDVTLSIAFTLEGDCRRFPDNVIDSFAKAIESRLYWWYKLRETWEDVESGGRSNDSLYQKLKRVAHPKRRWGSPGDKRVSATFV